MNLSPKTSKIKLLGEQAEQISNTHLMAPFLMQLITSGDTWAYIGSNHAITAGRKNPDHSLFPYYTQDKLYDLLGSSGSMTIIRNKSTTWIPFSKLSHHTQAVSQSVCKSVSGTKIQLSEFHHHLNLSFLITWTSSNSYGLIRHAELINHNDHEVQVEILDGIQNIMTPGIDQLFQNTFSNLTDAYKRSEWLGNNLAAYSLSSIPTDKAEPNECLRATSVWSTGLEIKTHHLSRNAIDMFLSNAELVSEDDSRGKSGCYLIQSDVTIDHGGSKSWWIVADVEQSAAQITRNLNMLQQQSNSELTVSLQRSIHETTSHLEKMVAEVDGVQHTNHKKKTWRHFSNTLFNMMRGGTFPLGYQIPVNDFKNHIKNRNRDLYKKQKTWIDSLPERLNLSQLKDLALTSNNRDLIRIAHEYLPLTFSRRHGDPSRPWNRFSIEIKDDEGNSKYAYQGNWRDIFQNWEALLHSFPDYTESVMTRFLNATTFDGYNPYRITQDGFDWEREEPGSPWSNIGYWGDHQIIYLLKILELSYKTSPEDLIKSLGKENFVFAAVPYRIKNLDQIIQNARSSIEYDHQWSDQIDSRTNEIGSDGQLVTYKNGDIVYSTLTEKLLIPLLAKLSNYVPGAGIWMNTQRPEWNDANNALAGYGTSVVTMGYILRYVDFLIQIFDDSKDKEFSTHSSVKSLFMELNNILSKDISAGDKPKGRYHILKTLGESGSEFRHNFYNNGIEESRETISQKDLLEFLIHAKAHIQHSLKQNQRDDGLFHSYNLLRFREKDHVEIENLTLMLEGQVSILSSGLLSASQGLKLLNALEDSDLYRANQNSYLLYPDRELPGILKKGIIADELVKKSKTLSDFLDRKDYSIINLGDDQKVRFNGSFHNANHLKSRLDMIDISDKEKLSILELYEQTFQHHQFTGRSRSFFAYEGLGSIYWHMVSKLLLAVQELIIKNEKQDSQEKAVLMEHFRKIQNGIGVNKSPEEYGAFTIDPYSHTPAHTGVQQPGMTGQVKEDFIVRLYELGVRIADGIISFSPTLIDPSEYFTSETVINENTLPSHSLQFTLCNIPVILKSQQSKSGVEVIYTDKKLYIEGNILSKEISRQVFSRSSDIIRIEVSV